MTSSQYSAHIYGSLNILGIPVTPSEYDTYEQIRKEMLASGKTPADAQVWAACAIGIGSAVREAQVQRDEYARIVEAGR